MEACGHYYAADVESCLLALLVQFDSVGRANFNASGAVVKLAGAFVDDVDGWMNIGGVHVYGFAGVQLGVVVVWYFHRTYSGAKVTAHAL